MLLSAYGEGADVIKASRLFRSFEERLPPGLGVDAGARRVRSLAETNECACLCVGDSDFGRLGRGVHTRHESCLHRQPFLLPMLRRTAYSIFIEPS